MGVPLVDEGIRDILIATAMEIGRYQRDEFGKGHRMVGKGRFDYATAVDLACHDIGVQRFREKGLPYVIVSEEAEEPLRLGDSGVLYFDPLEGTHNFARGRKESGFGVTMAVVQESELQYVLFYNAWTGELYEAQRGGGAFVSYGLSRQRLVVSSGTGPVDIGFSYWPDAAGVGGYLERLTVITDSTPTSLSDAVDLVWVARGSLDGLVFVYGRAEAWDMAPALLVEEAGGVVTNMKGEAWYRPGGDGLIRVEGGLVAAGPEMHSRLLDLFRTAPLGPN